MESGQYQRATGGRLPDWYVKQPPRTRGDHIYLTAYARLATERRAFPGDIGPIPWSAVDTYGRRYGFGPWMHEHFVNVIMGLDRSYREHVKDKEAQEESKAKRRAAKAEKRAQQKTNLSGLQQRRAALMGGE